MSLATLQAALNVTDRTNSEQNDELQRLINSASDEIHRRSGREIRTTPQPPAAQTRTFDIDIQHRGQRELRVGDMATVPTLVEIRDAEIETALVQDATAYVVPLPRVRRYPWLPYTRLRFLYRAALWPLGENLTSWPRVIVRVTSTWGFPSVPEDLAQACVAFAGWWYIRDIERQSMAAEAAGASGAGRIEAWRTAADRAAGIVDSYQRIRL